MSSWWHVEDFVSKVLYFLNDFRCVGNAPTNTSNHSNQFIGQVWFCTQIRLFWGHLSFGANFKAILCPSCGILCLQPIYILHREGKSYSLIYYTTYVKCHSKISTGIYTMFKIEQHLGPLEQVPATSIYSPSAKALLGLWARLMWHFEPKSGHFSRRVARIPVGDRDRIARKYWTLSSGPDERRIDTLWHFLAKK